MTRGLAIVAPLVIGAFLGAIIGHAATGGAGFALVWALGIPIVIVVGVLLIGSRSAARARASSVADLAVGQTLGAARPPRLRRGIAAVLVVTGAALTLIPAYTMLGWIAGDVLAGRPFDGRDMRTGLHQGDAVAQIAEVVGSPDMSYVAFYDEYVIATARTAPRSTTADSYMWRHGSATRIGAASFSADLASELFDTSAIDFSIIPRLISIAKRDSGLNDADDFYPSVRRGAGDDAGPGDPVISISLSNDYFSAYYTFSLHGDLIDKSGTAFE